MSSSAGNLVLRSHMLEESSEMLQAFCFRRICGFKPTVSEDSTTSVMENVSRAMTLPETAKEVEQLTQQLNSIIKEVDITMQAQPNPTNKVSYWLFLLASEDA